MTVDELTELNDDDEPKNAEKQVESEDMTMNRVATGDMNMKAVAVTELNYDDKLKNAEKQVECNKIEDIWGIIVLRSSIGGSEARSMLRKMMRMTKIQN